ncbi:hypothetical protein BDN71DRAFT_459060 [Pleurotus eryngii]|uniref:Uncharacterized protein n=1 Tax=Pleurotus eryngii TaxID=5323 RepID=A0A9P5ZJN5_PLEER|nr:hypothetical protein BDN71DRAFT_459060 [Pleurotus eryngii]
MEESVFEQRCRRICPCIRMRTVTQEPTTFGTGSLKWRLLDKRSELSRIWRQRLSGIAPGLISLFYVPSLDTRQCSRLLERHARSVSHNRHSQPPRFHRHVLHSQRLAHTLHFQLLPPCRGPERGRMSRLLSP